MNDTYRISRRVARTQFALSSGLTLLVLTYFTITSLRKDEDVYSTSGVVVAVAIGGAFYYWRNYKRAVAFASTHALTLASDSILFRDGATETRIPYNAIELLTIRRSYLGNASFTLKGAGIATTPYYGYDNIEELISSLANRLPRDRIKGHAVHA